ncbi:MAG: GNAT family N-acetyltransferase [Proteobacteria bacterium]|nr:GNAT family N-acetyltransferase [Pseudomonadota bacterium]
MHSQEAFALVLGMSIHGLAISRALARAGIEVYAIEQSPQLPATATRYAKVLYADGINSERAADILLEQRRFLPQDRPAVLYASSDNMVRSIAANWSRLEPYFRVSWSDSISTVQHLINKANLEQVCRDRDVLYPRSSILGEGDSIDAAIEEVGLPILVKPIRPLSGFKAVHIEHAEQLHRLVDQFRGDLPFLVQRWIPGGDETLYFCSMVLDNSQPLAVFTGRKLRAFPSGTGVGTVVESCPAPDVRAISEQFVAGLGLSGPIAIEYKRDPEGRYWLIEPNVGRTEYSVDLIIQHGLNFPLLEYKLAQGRPEAAPDMPRREVIWYDSERDPLCYAKLCWQQLTLKPYGKTPVLPYFGYGDSRPLLRALRRLCARLVAAPINRLERLLGRGGSARLSVHANFDALPQDARELIERYGAANPFLTSAWYRNYEQQVACREGESRWYCVRNLKGRLYGVWPLVRIQERGRVILRAMGNYYTPYATLPFDVDAEAAAEVFTSAVAQLLTGVDKIDVRPVAPDDSLIEFLKRPGQPHAVIEPKTVNWSQRVTSVEAYFDALSGKLRSTIVRKMRALAAHTGVEFRIHTSVEGLDAAMDDYFSVYVGSWKLPEPFPEFIRGLARLAAGRGWLRLGLLKIGGQPVAAQLWLVRDGVAYIYKLAYVSASAQWSPGTVLTWHLVENVVKHDQVTRLDYLTGDDSYKQDWMTDARTLSRVTFANWRRPFGLLFVLRSLWQRRARSGAHGAGP